EPLTIESAALTVTGGRFTMGTVMARLGSRAELENPAVVKVLVDAGQRAIYFSRHPIPYSRGEIPGSAADFASRRHLGIYAYSRETLFKIRQLPPSPIERGEVLEQLR